MTNNLDTQKISSSLSPFGYLRRWFFAGLLVSAPILLTGYIIWLIVDIIDGQVSQLLPAHLNPQEYLSFHLPGIGLIIAVITIIVIGALTTGFIGRSLIKLGERLVNSVPVIRSVYGAIKQIMETIMASQSDAFREVVLVEYPRKGIWAIGFVTGTTKGEVQNMSSENLINVFVPTTPNPTSGFLLFFRREEAITLEMGVEEAVKMVVSGGIVTPDDPRANRTRASLNKTAAKTSGKKSGKMSAKKVQAKVATKKAATKKAATKKAATKKAAAKKS